MDPLRARLRAETRPEHEALDAAFGALDLSEPRDYATFLRAHHAASTLIEPLIAPAPGRVAALVSDIGQIGGEVTCGFAYPALQNAHPLGLAYVVAGSHLGAKVLRKRVESASIERFRNAKRYFALPGTAEHWQAVLDSLTNVKPTEADAVIDGARIGFGCFAAALVFVKQGAG